VSVGRGLLRRYLGRLRFPWLFLLTLIVLVVDVAIPDVIPVADELLLTLLGLLLGSLKTRRSEEGADGKGPS